MKHIVEIKSFDARYYSLGVDTFSVTVFGASSGALCPAATDEQVMILRLILFCFLSTWTFTDC
jgi:hypothetical protein